jgi:prickle
MKMFVTFADLPFYQVIRYMDSLPKEKVPKIGSAGIDYWMKQQAFQLPEHDTNPEKCHKLDEDEKRKQETYKQKLELGVMAEGQVAEIVIKEAPCWRCQKTMVPGEMAVQAEVGSGCHMWHPACFTCETDSELLVPLIYFYQDDKLYCGRHYGETLLPRCHACDELIFCHHFTVAEGHKWHQKHFCCFCCDQPLAIGDTSQPYINHNDHIYCTKCFTKEIAEHCHGCGNPITAGDKHLIHEDTNWHTACFICSQCEAELASMPFYRRDEKYLCPTCFEGAFGKVCGKCGDGIQTSSKSFVLSDKHWHEGCFVCIQCKESLAGRSIVNHETGLYCPTCYYEALGDKCHVCKKPIGVEG